MKVKVLMVTEEGLGVVVPHEGEWVSEDNDRGHLTVTVEDRDGNVTGWSMYAPGGWLRAWLEQGPDQEVVRHREQARERDRTTATPNHAFGNFGPR